MMALKAILLLGTLLSVANAFSAIQTTDDELYVDKLLKQLDSVELADENPYQEYTEHLPSTEDLMKENKKVSETTKEDDSPMFDVSETATDRDDNFPMFDAGIAPYEALGCYKDVTRPRPIPELLENLRSQIDWYNMNKTVIACAKRVQAKGYRYFGIQFYGECWSGEKAGATYAKDGKSDQCWKGVGKGGSYFVYRFSAATTTKFPTTQPTTTEATTTKEPTTEAPTTKETTTEAPTTEEPTEAPTTSPAAPECSRYRTLSSGDRAVGNRGSRYLCDNRLIRGWYRFTGDAGDRMPTRCPTVRRCGTHAPGWMTGTLPSVDEGAVSRTVCFHWVKNCCKWKNVIQVRNCGGFYVYLLVKPPACRLRYCGDKEQVPTMTPSPLPTTPKPGRECFVYRHLSSASRSMERKGSLYQCDNNLRPGWYRFSGDAGENMPTKCVPKYHCGTHAPGWMNGKLPSVIEGAVKRQVCFHWYSNCCKWTTDVKVRNCGRFFVYWLQKPPVCRLRYCGDATPLADYCEVQGPGNHRNPKDCSTYITCLHGKGIIRSCPKGLHWNDKKKACDWPNQAGCVIGTPTPTVPFTTPPPPTTSKPECPRYRTLSSGDRAVGNRGSRYLCDNRLIRGWYRFTGDAGDRMPTKCPAVRRCGTHAPGWMNGTLPSVDDGAVPRRVCFHWVKNCCKWKNDIQVRNCGGFYVYLLDKPPACRLRYCGDKEQAPTTTPSSLPTTPKPLVRVYRLCEGRNGVLRCPKGQRIKVLYANYGRTHGRQICPHNSIRTTNCRSAESSRLIRCACQGRYVCPLFARNEVYGDPCYLTYKYIEVRYICV